MSRLMTNLVSAAVAALVLTGCGSEVKKEHGDAKPMYSTSIDPQEKNVDGETRAEYAEGIRSVQAQEGYPVAGLDQIDDLAASVCQRAFEGGTSEFKAIEQEALTRSEIEGTDHYYIMISLILRLAGIYDCTPSEIEAARAAEPSFAEPQADPSTVPEEAAPSTTEELMMACHEAEVEQCHD